MIDEFDDGREYPTNIVWKKARGFYANIAISVSLTINEIIENGVSVSWPDLFIVKSRLRAEIEDLQAEVRERKKTLAALDKLTLQKAEQTQEETDGNHQ